MRALTRVGISLVVSMSCTPTHARARASQDVPVFTMVDDTTIGDKEDATPPEGTPRVVEASKAAEVAAQLAAAKK